MTRNRTDPDATRDADSARTQAARDADATRPQALPEGKSSRTWAAIGAEWTKLWTTRTVWWALGAATLLMLAGAAQYAIYATNGDLSPELMRDGAIPAGLIAVQAVGIAQLAFVALAMLVMTSEHSTGTIRATLAWIPSRGRLLSAKCAVVMVVTFVAGAIAGLLGALAASPLLGDLGSSAGIVQDSLKIGTYLAVLAVLATGLGAALRGPVLTLVVILMLIVVIPPLLQVPDVPALNAIADSMPGVAGSNFLLGGDTTPYPPTVGLLILTAWAAAAAVTGWQAMHRTDA